MSSPDPEKPRTPLGKRAVNALRGWFITGVAAAAPIGITVWLVWSVVDLVDRHVKPLIPKAWNPETYLPVALPGFGILVAVVAITLLGFVTTRGVGQFFIRQGERLVERVPLVRQVYRVLKQVVDAFSKTDGASFKEAVMVEYPRPGTWALAFITNPNPGGEIARRQPGAIGVFVPTSPNPVTGFLIYVQPDQVVKLDMPVDQAVKLVVSVGMLSPEQLAGEGK
jgi:uncharacterized membrane protein